jgi:hypothetical protein
MEIERDTVVAPTSSASNRAVTKPWLTIFTGNSMVVPHGAGGGIAPAKSTLTRSSGLMVILTGGSSGLCPF